jgi:hypothetical protein
MLKILNFFKKIPYQPKEFRSMMPSMKCFNLVHKEFRKTAFAFGVALLPYTYLPGGLCMPLPGYI